MRPSFANPSKETTAEVLILLCPENKEKEVLKGAGAAKGRMKHSDLERLFDGKIDDDSILCTDSHKSFISFAKNMEVELHQIPRGKHKEGIYHIQHINAFHNNLKRWMSKLNGVATKYLSNYLYWFRLLQMFNSEKDSAKSKHLIVQSHSIYSDTKIRSFKTRQIEFS